MGMIILSCAMEVLVCESVGVKRSSLSSQHTNHSVKSEKLKNAYISMEAFVYFSAPDIGYEYVRLK